MRHLLATTSARFATLIDGLIASHGMALLFHPEWITGRVDAWKDEQGAFTLHCWRFEFIRDGRAPVAGRA